MKNLYFIFYQDNDYLSDRLLMLYDKINPKGIWKFINIYGDEILNRLPIKLDSLPAVYNVLNKEIYLEEYVFEFIRSFDSVKYNKYAKIINERLEERDDNEKETINKVPTSQRIDDEEYNIKPVIQGNNMIYEQKDIDLYQSNPNITQEKFPNPYDEGQSYSLSFNDNYDNYSGIENTEILDGNERKYINTINTQIKDNYDSMKKDRSKNIRKTNKSVSVYDL